MTGKVVKPDAEQLHVYSWSFFEFLVQEKQILFFLCGLLIIYIILQSGATLLGLTKSNINRQKATNAINTSWKNFLCFLFRNISKEPPLIDKMIKWGS